MRTRPATLTTSVAVWHLSASAIRANVIALAVGCRIERSRVVVGELAVTPLAFGALRLQAPDGRVSLFPRAMCSVRAADGREGRGWVEWNRVQHPEAGESG